jgi:hypothetical protein
MAIQIDIDNSQYGVSFSSAYCRIVIANISRVVDKDEKHFVMMDVAGYAVQPENDDVRAVEFKRYHALLSDIEARGGDTFLSKCYEWLMSQPGMEDAIAV